jgi:hypothetical protein
MRRTARYSLDHKINYILESLKVDPVEKKLAQYKQESFNRARNVEGIR